MTPCSGQRSTWVFYSVQRTPAPAKIASIALSAVHGSRPTGFWVVHHRERQTGSTSATGAASNASLGTTTAAVGSPRSHQPYTVGQVQQPAPRARITGAPTAPQWPIWTRCPKRWVIALDEDSPHQRRLYIEAFWSDRKLRWARRAVIPRTNNPNQSTTLDVDTWYKICQKVRRRCDRNSYWAAASAKIHQENPDFNKAEIRARARILALVDQFTADIQASSDTSRVPTVGRGHRQVGPGPRLGSTRLLSGWGPTVTSPSGPRRSRPPCSSATSAERSAARQRWTTSAG